MRLIDPSGRLLLFTNQIVDVLVPAHTLELGVGVRMVSTN